MAHRSVSRGHSGSPTHCDIHAQSGGSASGRGACRGVVELPPAVARHQRGLIGLSSEFRSRLLRYRGHAGGIRRAGTLHRACRSAHAGPPRAREAEDGGGSCRCSRPHCFSSRRFSHLGARYRGSGCRDRRSSGRPETGCRQEAGRTPKACCPAHRRGPHRDTAHPCRPNQHTPNHHAPHHNAPRDHPSRHHIDETGRPHGSADEEASCDRRGAGHRDGAGRRGRADR